MLYPMLFDGVRAVYRRVIHFVSITKNICLPSESSKPRFANVGSVVVKALSYKLEGPGIDSKR